jgi:hypothetical protein
MRYRSGILYVALMGSVLGCQQLAVVYAHSHANLGPSCKAWQATPPDRGATEVCQRLLFASPATVWNPLGLGTSCQEGAAIAPDEAPVRPEPTCLRRGWFVPAHKAVGVRKPD